MGMHRLCFSSREETISAKKKKQTKPCNEKGKSRFQGNGEKNCRLSFL